MACRPYENLIAGELDNTVPGKVTGWIDFYRSGGEPLHVTLDLRGDCHRDLQGHRFRITNPHPAERFPEGPRSYVHGLDPVQRGEAGDLTAGGPPTDYVDYPYIEWYSEANGRVVLELDRDQLEILTTQPTFRTAAALDRSEQHANMDKFLGELAAATRAPFTAVVQPRPKQKPRREA